MSTDSIEDRVKQVVDKVAADHPTSPEDVHIVALAWAVSDQQEEAAAGTTTGADLDLLSVVRAQPFAGDAAAQTVCDAACRWRDRTRLNGDAGPTTFRWLLAQTVDRHRRSRWKKHRLRIARCLGWLSGGFLLTEGLMSFARLGPPIVHQALIAAAIGCFAASLALLFRFSRANRR